MKPDLVEGEFDTRVPYRAMKVHTSIDEALSAMHTRIKSGGKVGNSTELDPQSEVISGPKALRMEDQLNNNGYMKKTLNHYVVNNRRRNTAVPAYRKSEFVPFVDERDHLG